MAILLNLVLLKPLPITSVNLSKFTLPFHERFRQIRVMNVQFLWGVERIGHFSTKCRFRVTLVVRG